LHGAQALYADQWPYLPNHVDAIGLILPLLVRTS
jgi:hypothetical protein